MVHWYEELPSRNFSQSSIGRIEYILVQTGLFGRSHPCAAAPPR